MSAWGGRWGGRWGAGWGQVDIPVFPMYPPIFATCAAVTAVKTLIGSNPVRLFLFGEAPQSVTLPYAVWRTIYGTPENQLGDVPDTDGWGVQVDVYAATAASARSVAQALRNAIVPVAYITAWRGESRDPVTRNYNYQFDVDWILSR